MKKDIYDYPRYTILIALLLYFVLFGLHFYFNLWIIIPSLLISGFSTFALIIFFGLHLMYFLLVLWIIVSAIFDLWATLT